MSTAPLTPASAAAASSTSSLPLRTWPGLAHLTAHYDCLLFDCDGVLWEETHVIDGAIETLKELERMGILLLFVTNNSSKTREQYVQKLLEMGFVLNITADNILCSSYATARFLVSSPAFDKTLHKVYTIGDVGISKELKAVGIESVDSRKMFDRHLTKDELSQLPLDPSIGAVVVGIDDQLTYTKVSYAISHLRAPWPASSSTSTPRLAIQEHHERCGTRTQANSPSGVLLISTNQDANLPTKGHDLPGAGSCVAIVAAAAEVPLSRVINIGKPDPFMFQLAVERFATYHGRQLTRSRCLMIGDRLDTDIWFAQRSGIDSLFVLTGIHSVADLQRDEFATSGIRPTFVAQSVKELIGGAEQQ